LKLLSCSYILHTSRQKRHFRHILARRERRVKNRYLMHVQAIKRSAQLVDDGLFSNKEDIDQSGLTDRDKEDDGKEDSEDEDYLTDEDEVYFKNDTDIRRFQPNGPDVFHSGVSRSNASCLSTNSDCESSNLFSEHHSELHTATDCDDKFDDSASEYDDEQENFEFEIALLSNVRHGYFSYQPYCRLESHSISPSNAPFEANFLSETSKANVKTDFLSENSRAGVRSSQSVDNITSSQLLISSISIDDQKEKATKKLRINKKKLRAAYNAVRVVTGTTKARKHAGSTSQYSGSSGCSSEIYDESMATVDNVQVDLENSYVSKVNDESPVEITPVAIYPLSSTNKESERDRVSFSLDDLKAEYCESGVDVPNEVIPVPLRPASSPYKENYKETPLLTLHIDESDNIACGVTSSSWNSCTTLGATLDSSNIVSSLKSPIAQSPNMDNEDTLRSYIISDFKEETIFEESRVTPKIVPLFHQQSIGKQMKQLTRQHGLLGYERAKVLKSRYTGNLRNRRYSEFLPTTNRKQIQIKTDNSEFVIDLPHIKSVNSDDVWDEFRNRSIKKELNPKDRKITFIELNIFPEKTKCSPVSRVTNDDTRLQQTLYLLKDISHMGESWMWQKSVVLSTDSEPDLPDKSVLVSKPVQPSASPPSKLFFNSARRYRDAV